MNGLKRFFQENNKAALAFSGGVDSAYLLYAAKACGCDVRAYFADTAFQPRFEAETAKRVAEEIGVPLTVLTPDVLALKDVIKNDENRCYYCKRAVFGLITAAAAKDGYSLLLDGTNASDDEGDRPGMRATAELSVRSPLKACGLTKADVRRLSRAAGLSTWDKPAYACLATRIPTGTAIGEDTLKKVEAAETFLRGLGFSDLRVRTAGTAAKLQLPVSQQEEAVRRGTEICDGLRKHFTEVLLDLQPRLSE